VLAVLGFGAFHEYAPWTLLHKIPIFKSQHVPSRWQYPALLMLTVVTASVVERVFRRSGRARGWIEVALVAAVGWIAFDVARVARQPLMHAFPTRMPDIQDSTGEFHTEVQMPASFNYPRDWSPPSLPAEIANIGTIECGTFAGLHSYFRDKHGRMPGIGAHGRDDPAYKGEAFVSEGEGRASIAQWSPNQMTIHVTGARSGEHLVLNQNWDPGWRANGSPAVNVADAVAYQLQGSDETVVFRYRPRTWWLGLGIFLATTGVIVQAYRLARRARRVRAGRAT
jgi:hypothetical protein